MNSMTLAALIMALALPGAALAQTSACDLNQDGKVDSADVQLATNMALGTSTCTAAVVGSGVCNVVVVQRVVNAALGGTCVTGTGAVAHTVALKWTASTSANVTGYKVYRATVSGGPYTLLTASPVAATSFTDSTVLSGQTYYYVTAAIDSSNNESTFSTQVSAIIPTT